MLDKRSGLRTIHEIVAQVLAGRPDFVVREVGGVEKLVSDEGEHGALVAVLGAVAGRPTWLCIGALFGDDFHVVFTGSARDALRANMRAHRLGLGRRERGYLYTPPPGWAGGTRSLLARWRHPHLDAEIHVLPARPAREPATSLVEGIARREPGVAHIDGPRWIGGAHGLDGRLWRIDHERFQRHVAVLDDGQYHYCLGLRVEAGQRAPIETFLEVLGSVQPIPTACAAAPPACLAHWAA